MSDKVYDCIIVGAGPAGLAAAIYTARDRKSTLMLEKQYPGGQITVTDRIENYPGYDRISGPDLVMKMLEQAQNFGAELKSGVEVTEITKLDDGNTRLDTTEGPFLAHCVILSPGSSFRKLGVPGEEKFRQAGAGVSYCGTCDAPFFRDKKVIAVGGGNTAVEETIHLAKFAAEVTLVHRRQEFRATPVLVEELMDNVNSSDGNIKLVLDSVCTSINGTDKVESATIQNVKTEETSELDCDGVFIFIGTVPNTDFLKDTFEVTESGFLRCDPVFLRTAMPGVFVAGDCRVDAPMQLATAVGDGVAAAMAMKSFCRDPKWWDMPAFDSLTPGTW
ncbi:Thioredoxin reductase [Anaerohalosphaera lusitana]|uniref:Thioredoxin reductase n=1 Tax=Anaerohalosphaera lusitana TaxID=1936003 RepID=A0A1U9NI27_9BACT|nr:FAD-dependent oxidoreductase [Anaerohalosphaera lusitana]AQT67260.1 Thioredoxin reductase [Anaerohalosphaera lusitana]